MRQLRLTFFAFILSSATFAGPTIHSQLVNSNPSHELHVPGWVVANPTVQAAVTNAMQSDILYRQSDKTEWRWNGTAWEQIPVITATFTPTSTPTGTLTPTSTPTNTPTATFIPASKVSFNNAGTNYTATTSQAAHVEADNWLRGTVPFPAPISITSASAILIASGAKLTLGPSSGANFSLLDTDGYGLKDVNSTISILGVAPVTFGVLGGPHLLIDASNNSTLTSQGTGDIRLISGNAVSMNASGSDLTMHNTGDIVANASNAISLTDSSSAQLALPGTNSISLITPFEGFSADDTGAYGTAAMFNAAVTIKIDGVNGGITSTDFSGSRFQLDGLGGSTWFTQSGEGWQFYGDGSGNLDETTFADHHGNNFDINSSSWYMYNTTAGHGLIMDFGGQTSLHFIGDGTGFLSAPVTGSMRVNGGGVTEILNAGAISIRGGNIDMNFGNITSLASPSTSSDAVPRSYVDALVPSGVFSFAVSFVNPLTTPVTVLVPGASSTSFIAFGERGTALASSFGWTSPGPGTIVCNGTAVSAVTVTAVGVK